MNEKIVFLRASEDGLTVVERSVTTEQADQIVGELLDAHADTGVELLLVRARRGKLSLVDVAIPAETVAWAVADTGQAQ